MAKKAAKKETSSKAKPAKKAPAKPVPKAAKPAGKAPVAVKAPVKMAKPAAAAKPVPTAKAAPAPAAKAAAAKPAPAPAKAQKPEKAAPPPPPPPPAKPAKAVANGKLALVKDAPKAGPEAAKGEKRPKIDKAGMSDEQVRWHDLQFKHKNEKPQVYNMTAQFEANKPIQHKVLGWGFVLSNENDRLEVLFEQGIKMLISNYKAP